MAVEPLEIEVRTAVDLSSALAMLEDNPSTPLDLILVDLRLPDGDGIEIIKRARMWNPAPAVAVITAYGTPESAVEAMKAGAFDYLAKPIDIHRLRSLVRHGLRLAESDPAEVTLEDSTLIGSSMAMTAVRRQIARVARSEAPVIISGESGTGKELVARSIHAASLRQQRPFVPVNCSAIPEHLIESELFGYRKGAFTGATGSKEGLFQTAEHGILFLDEVGDLPLPVQGSLLRALQERAVRPLGETREIPVDVRVLAATRRNLTEEMAAGRFREDLYYRLDVLRVDLPPLREHPEDIPEIARALLARRFRRADDPPVPTLSARAVERLMTLPYKGNVRELANVLERALTRYVGTTIEAEAIPQPEGVPTKPSPAQSPEEHVEFQLDQHLADTERCLIQEALEATRGHKTAAAARLGISLRSLRYRIHKLGME